jgi:hypothetical protein
MVDIQQKQGTNDPVKRETLLASICFQHQSQTTAIQIRAKMEKTKISLFKKLMNG